MIKGLDISISVLYILGIVAIGLLAGLKKKKVAKGDASSDYFLAGKSLRWPMIIAVVYFNNVGVWSGITVELATNVNTEKISNNKYTLV